MKTTRPMARLLLAAAFLSLWLGSAAAQDIDAGNMVRGGLQAIQMIDQGKAGELWDGATAATRKRVSRADFISQVAKGRAPLGAPQQRAWVNISRLVATNADAEIAGQYISIEYEARFANKPDATSRELVSFHLDRDNIWRFTGYELK